MKAHIVKNVKQFKFSKKTNCSANGFFVIKRGKKKTTDTTFYIFDTSNRITCKPNNCNNTDIT